MSPRIGPVTHGALAVVGKGWDLSAMPAKEAVLLAVLILPPLGLRISLPYAFIVYACDKIFAAAVCRKSA